MSKTPRVIEWVEEGDVPARSGPRVHYRKPTVPPMVKEVLAAKRAGSTNYALVAIVPYKGAKRTIDNFRRVMKEHNIAIVQRQSLDGKTVSVYARAR